MAKHPLSKRDDEYDLTRRALIKWTVAAGAALGVSRSNVFQILLDTKMDGMAHALTDIKARRSVICVDGGGGLSNWTLLWTHPQVAASPNNNFASIRPGQGQLLGTTGLWNHGFLPWVNLLPESRQASIFIAGNNETHTSQPTVAGMLQGNSVLAAAQVMAASIPTTIPTVITGGLTLGQAPGSQQGANANAAAQFVGLFNSAASQAGGLLSNPKNAAGYLAQYQAFSALNRASTRVTNKAPYKTASGAAKFLGINLASQLQITQADRTMYGLTANTQGNIRDIAETLIVAVKAFKLGLCNSVVFPGMTDDPHGLWDGNNQDNVATSLLGVMNGWMTHMLNTTDDLTGGKIADSVCFSVHGDTMKDPFNRPGWGDGTQSGESMVIVWSNGDVKPGYYGRYDINTGNVTQSIGRDGNLVAGYNAANTAQVANASFLYAASQRHLRETLSFTGNLDLTRTLWNAALDT